jgi:hypothetical protein
VEARESEWARRGVGESSQEASKVSGEEENTEEELEDEEVTGFLVDSEEEEDSGRNSA